MVLLTPIERFRGDLRSVVITAMRMLFVQIIPRARMMGIEPRKSASGGT